MSLIKTVDLSTKILGARTRLRNGTGLWRETSRRKPANFTFATSRKIPPNHVDGDRHSPHRSCANLRDFSGFSLLASPGPVPLHTENARRHFGRGGVAQVGSQMISFETIETQLTTISHPTKKPLALFLRELAVTLVLRGVLVEN